MQKNLESDDDEQNEEEDTKEVVKDEVKLSDIMHIGG